MVGERKNRCHHRHEIPCPGFKMHRFVQPCMLLLLFEKPSHGYELMEKLSSFAFDDENPDSAMVYRNLRRMEEESWIKSQWQTEEGGPAKRLYTITKEGEEALHGWASHVKKQLKRLELFLEKYERYFDKGN
jgi:PadR family transcriptional regulator PadR